MLVPGREVFIPLAPYCVGMPYSLLSLSVNGISKSRRSTQLTIAERPTHLQNLLRGSLRQETLQLSHLEGALCDMQRDFRVRNRFRQLAMLVIARATPNAELSGLRELFESLDVDNSGQLSMEELRRGLKRMDSQVGTRVMHPSDRKASSYNA